MPASPRSLIRGVAVNDLDRRAVEVCSPEAVATVAATDPCSRVVATIAAFSDTPAPDDEWQRCSR
jgi:hypothetical protein